MYLSFKKNEEIRIKNSYPFRALTFSCSSFIFRLALSVIIEHYKPTKHNIVGIIELDHAAQLLFIHSNLYLYGSAINEDIRRNMQSEINEMWNAPSGLVWLDQNPYSVRFKISVFLKPNIQPEDVINNSNPLNNYFRVEEFVHGNISFVDGLGCNTGYFLLENLYPGSTTSAHEFGHTLGLPHPDILDIRGKGIPGIMYPRGTLVDPPFQYDASVKAGEKGGTLYPIHRRVLQADIDDLGLSNLIKNNNLIIGKFSSRFHEAHLPNSPMSA